MAALLSSLMTVFAVVNACSTSDDTTTDQPDGQASDGAGATSGCPSTAPDAGASCAFPEGTTCEFGQCGTPIAQCTRGTWVYGGNTPPKSVCPMIAPNADASCPMCWDPSVTCSYGSTDCSQPDASDQTTLASCPSGRWAVEFSPCRDAGPDVQGDGGEDAD